MALIEYQITYQKDGKTLVTSQVVEVDEGDRIRFKSNMPAGIRYIKKSPFKDGPQPNEIFLVKSQTAAFEVANKSTSRNPIHFDCGPPPPKTEIGEKWNPWGAGGDTPPGD
jgi:hypothetical protein